MGSCDQSSDEITHLEFLPTISAGPSFGPFSELERPHQRLAPWRTLRTCDRKTRHLVLNPREGEHDRQSCLMDRPRHPTSRSSSSSTTCPAPIRQGMWVGNRSTREPTDPVVLVGAVGDHATRATWHHYLEQLGRRQGPVEVRTIRPSESNCVRVLLNV